MSTTKGTGYPPPPYGQGYTNGAGYPQVGNMPGGGYLQAGAYPAYSQGSNISNSSSTNVVVTQPSGGPGQIMYIAPYRDYMIASVLTCIFCFWPTGIAAIYYASQARDHAARGDMMTANRMSNSARNLMISSIVIGVIWITLFIVLKVVVYSNTYSNCYSC